MSFMITRRSPAAVASGRPAPVKATVRHAVMRPVGVNSSQRSMVQAEEGGLNKFVAACAAALLLTTVNASFEPAQAFDLGGKAGSAIESTKSAGKDAFGNVKGKVTSDVDNTKDATSGFAGSAQSGAKDVRDNIMSGAEKAVDTLTGK